MSSIVLSTDNPLLRPGYLSLAPVRSKSAAHRPQITTLRHRSVRVVLPGIGHRGETRAPGGHLVLTWSSLCPAVTGQAGAVWLIQQVSGCRVGEALALSTQSIILPDQLIISALKRSRSRAIRIPELHQQFAHLKEGGIHPLFGISYSQIYRQYRNAGIVQIRPDNRYNRVTHSLRQSYIQAVQMVSKDVGITADIVGHKSKRSTIIYLKKGTYHG